MPYAFALPDLGEGITEGEIQRFMVAVGDRIAEDAPLVEVETDKVTVDIPSPVAGQVTAVHGAPGDVVAVGTVLVEITRDGEADDAPAPTGAAEAGAAGAAGADEAGADDERRGGARGEPAGARPSREDRTAASATPKVRRLAGELGVALAAVPGTGPDGRVTEADVRAAAELGPSSGAGVTSTGSRRTIARRLTAAAAVPTVTNVDDCDFTAVRAAGVSPLVAVARASAIALGEHPGVNAWNVDDELQPQSAVHLGVATQSERGLVVPVVRDAAELDPTALDEAISQVTTAVREGRAGPEDLRGSTFTITSAGKLSGLFSTPLLNLPEVAILGLYRIEDRPVVRDGEVVVARMANLSITFDHRVLDGLDAAAFLARVKELCANFEW